MLHFATDLGLSRLRICLAWLRHTSTVAALSEPESMEATCAEKTKKRSAYTQLHKKMKGNHEKAAW